MADATTALKQILSELKRGSASLALLGDSREAELLPLDRYEARVRYMQIVRPVLEDALVRNRSQEWLMSGLLIVLFAAATALVIIGAFRSWDWAVAGAVPGLGVTAVQPIRVLRKIRAQNVALLTLPVLLPDLPPERAAEVIEKYLKESL